MRLALLLAFSVSVFAQSVQVGVEGGVPLTHVFEANILGSCAGCSQRTLPYLIGPKVEIHLWRPFYLDAEALYNRADYGFSNGTFLENLSNRWKIPILLKLQFNSRHFLRPFVAAGVSLQHSYSFTPPPAPNVTVGPGVNDSAIGATVAAGMRLGFRWVRPSIELRYTRWADPPIGTFAPTAQSKRDEAEILVGLLFGTGPSHADSPGVLEGPVSTRRVSLGVKGGVPLTDGLSARISATSSLSFFGTCTECGTTRMLPYVVGPALEFRIIGPLSVTAEAFYSRADYDHTSAGPFFEGPALDEEKHVVGRWEAPLLLKYSFKMRHLTPFLTAGGSIQYDRDSNVTEFFGELNIKTIPVGPPQYGFVSTRGPQVNSLVVGPTAGAGASFGAGRIRPSIEVRYTYWTNRAVAAMPLLTAPFGSPIRVFPPTIASLHNQAQLLVGIMF